MKTMSLAEVAELLQYSVKYFRDHYRGMGIPYVKLGKKVIFWEEDVFKWMAERYVCPLTR